MASANLDLVRSICAAWERGDFFGSSERLRPEIEYVYADGPDPGSRTGLAAVAEGSRGWLSAWEHYHVEVDEYRELDEERVLVLGHFSGRGKASGVEVAQEGAGVFHVRDGKVTRIVSYFYREHALADLGLDPEGR